MRETGRGGAIVNIGSILSFTGDGYLAAYTAMKSGVLGLTKAIAIDYALDGIRCNCVCPGDMETPMIEQYFDGTEDAAAARAEMEAAYPGKRIAHPREVATAVIYLALRRLLVRQRHTDPRRRRADRKDLLIPREAAMKFSYAFLPDHPVTELVDTIAVADELGFYGAYGADETYHKDQWLVAAVAATRTKNIRLSPCVTHVILKEPTIIAHSIATLDELSNGRAEAVFSIGNIAMLDQYHVDWKSGGQIKRLREAHHVMRTMLDEGKIDFEGEFYRYTGLFTRLVPCRSTCR